MQLTFYLFRDDITTLDDAIKTSKLKGKDAFRPVTLKSVPFTGKAYIQSNKRNTPPWLEYIKANCNPQDLGKLENTSCSFVLLINTSKRIFAVTMGQGHGLLREDGLEQDFGLRVTMNSVGKGRIRGLQARNFGGAPIHKQLIASRESERGAFDIDVYLDLLANLEGVVDGAEISRKKAAIANNKKLLGTRISGSTSCSLRHEASFTELGKKCDELWKAFDSKAYQKLFPEYDNIRLVSDAITLQTLRDHLVKLVVARDSSLSIALPDISVRGNIDYYRIRHTTLNAGSLTDMDIDEVYEWLTDNHAAGNDILDASIIGMDDSNRAVTQMLPIERIFVWEGKIGTESFVATLGRWYKIKNTYVKRQEIEFKEKTSGRILHPIPSYLPLYSKRIAAMKPVPPAKVVDREWQYNDSACKASNGKCHLLDGDFITVASNVEPCDIFTDKGFLIHVKRGTGNATTSHMLSQGSVSARFLKGDPEFRKQLRSKLPPALKNKVDVAQCDPQQYTVVYAIIEKTRSFPSDISFFKKLNVLHHLRILDGLNFKVAFCSIGHE